MNFLVELLFPRRCPVCDRPIDKMGRYICKKCRNKIQYIQSPFCMKCGKSLKDEAMEYCEDCKNATHLFERGRALYEYDTVNWGDHESGTLHTCGYAAGTLLPKGITVWFSIDK